MCVYTRPRIVDVRYVQSGKYSCAVGEKKKIKKQTSKNGYHRHRVIVFPGKNLPGVPRGRRAGTTAVAIARPAPPRAFA